MAKVIEFHVPKNFRKPFKAMAQAQLPNGAADIPPPGDEVHSY